MTQGAGAPCPLCGAPRVHIPRYPDRVCTSCVRRAVDESGRPLKFLNTTPAGGGFAAVYADTGDARNSHLCYIEGVQCRADEDYFGGIVVRPTAAKGAAKHA